MKYLIKKNIMKSILEYLVKKNIEKDDTVDLGLPSRTIWCTKNLGAKDKYDPGDYYAWGEIEHKKTFSRTNYKWVKRDDEYLCSKYTTPGDEILEILPEDDAINRDNSNFMIPMAEHFEELLANTTWEEDKKNGVLVFTSKINKEKLYIPLGGWAAKDVVQIRHKGECIRIWTGTINKDDDYEAYTLRYSPNFATNKLEVFPCGRAHGYNLRGIAVSTKH